MSTNNTFSFARLALVMKRDFMENWKTNLFWFLGIFIAFLAVYLIEMSLYNESWTEEYREVSRYVEQHSASFACIASFSLFIFASEMMRNMRTKENRFSYLMLPASMLEKFVSRALFVTVGTILMVFVASLLAEVVHWAFMPFFDDIPDKFRICVWDDAWGNIWETISPFKTKAYFMGSEGTSPETWPRVEKTVFPQIMMVYWMAIWWHSFYIIGGNYFGKYAFFKTTGTLILLGIALGYIMNGINPKECFGWIEEFAKNNEEWFTENFVAGVVGFIFFAFTALNWWLSYKLFTRSQVIKPKFRLL